MILTAVLVCLGSHVWYLCKHFEEWGEKERNVLFNEDGEWCLVVKLKKPDTVLGCIKKEN